MKPVLRFLGPHAESGEIRPENYYSSCNTTPYNLNSRGVKLDSSIHCLVKLLLYLLERSSYMCGDYMLKGASSVCLAGRARQPTTYESMAQSLRRGLSALSLKPGF